MNVLKMNINTKKKLAGWVAFFSLVFFLLFSIKNFEIVAFLLKMNFIHSQLITKVKYFSIKLHSNRENLSYK